MPNLIRNQKYSAITFIPQVLYEQFKYFFNLFYLLTALSQFIPVLKVGLMFSFVAPLLLVLFLTMLKEAYEDYQRFIKDTEVNSTQFIVLDKGNKYSKKSSELAVGDIIEVSTGENVPADCLLLATMYFWWYSVQGKGPFSLKPTSSMGRPIGSSERQFFPTMNCLKTTRLCLTTPKSTSTSLSEL